MPAATPLSIQRALKHYNNSLPASLAARVGAPFPSVYAHDFDCYGNKKEVLTVRDSEAVIVHDIYPDMANAVDGDIPDGHSYTVFASIQAFQQYMTDTHGNNKRAHAGHKLWARNLKI